MASYTGGLELSAINKVSAIITSPSILVKRSSKSPASFIQNINRAKKQLITAPSFGFSPVNTSSPSPQPPILPILKARPPITMSPVIKYPRPGISSLAMMGARLLLTTKILQIFNCAPMSNSIDSRITKPKLASSCWVKTVVCVKNPGPIAEVAIKKAAPNIAFCFFPEFNAIYFLQC